MDTFIEKIEAYLDDLLDETEKSAFEIALNEDEALRDALAKEKAIRAVQYQINKDDLRKRLAQLNATETSNSSAKVISMSWRKYALAASVIGLILFSYLLFDSKNNLDYQQLALENNIEYPIPTIQGEQEIGAIKKQFFQALELKQYTTALDLIHQIPNTELSEELKFLQAYALLQNKEYEKADITFSTISAGTYRDAADWYAIVAQLYMQNDVKLQVEKIKNNPNHAYQQKALELLRKLNS